MANIILGIFQQLRQELKVQYNASQYPFTTNDVVDRDTWISTFGVMNIVSIALSRCNKCYFVLDGISLPLPKDKTESVTYEELKFVLSHPHLLDKVIFVLGGKEMTEKEALTYLGRIDLLIN